MQKKAENGDIYFQKYNAKGSQLCEKVLGFMMLLTLSKIRTSILP